MVINIQSSWWRFPTPWVYLPEMLLYNLLYLIGNGRPVFLATIIIVTFQLSMMYIDFYLQMPRI